VHLCVTPSKGKPNRSSSLVVLRRWKILSRATDEPDFSPTENDDRYCSRTGEKIPLEDWSVMHTGRINGDGPIGKTHKPLPAGFLFGSSL